ncbi:SDR family NAD(P)-dependent oxidoreductase (plasmid) [Diaphorobacter sp. HDW4B]|uniref:SDR family NAD(P)-dependent oxidoreductase n=1 Tax=Diaphorobacter sp. HDW4B TaxID=2714925 RepID=UPI001407B42E|nr:SDR family NAD(P)-dependent oxidoreductase [Diaphorobacter sp. HDW4B]QIL74014.1 SDR family NAD(P)-dependent oxidoreductase [Diaphorobacter sp. HDW4B]
MQDFVLITGSSGGIGRECVKAFHAAGIGVFAADVRPHHAVTSPDLIPISMDLRQESSIEQGVELIRSHLGESRRLIGLVNNAGVDFNAPLVTLLPSEIRAMVDVNVVGSILLTRSVLSLLEPDRARLIFVGSAMGLFATPTVGVYAATKWAIEGLCDALRVELGAAGVRVALVEPGVVQTEMTAQAPQMLDTMLSRMNTEQRAMYEKTMRKIVQMSSAPGAGVGPQAVARTIVSAMTDPGMRSRYRVGTDSRIVGWLRHLPDGMRDFIQRKSLQL